MSSEEGVAQPGSSKAAATSSFENFDRWARILEQDCSSSDDGSGAKQDAQDRMNANQRFLAELSNLSRLMGVDLFRECSHTQEGEDADGDGWEREASPEKRQPASQSRVDQIHPKPNSVPDARSLLIFLRRYSPDLYVDLSSLPAQQRSWLHLFSVDAIHSIEKQGETQSQRPQDRKSRVVEEFRVQREHHTLGVANNFVKHCLFRHFRGCRLGMDLGCNRGQDVFKWRGLHPKQGVVFVDLLPLCLWITESRWKDAAYDFPATFLQADFCSPPKTLHGKAVYLHQLDTQRVKGEIRRPVLHSQLRLAPHLFDCISSQFAPVLAGGSIEQLSNYFRFCAWHLAPGGRLVISLTDGDYLQHCFRQAYHQAKRTESVVTEVTVDMGYAQVSTGISDPNTLRPLPTVYFLGSSPNFATGHPYRFRLSSQLDIQEHLVHPTELINQAEKAGLRIKSTHSFADIFYQEIAKPQNSNIMERMKLDTQHLPDKMHQNLKLYRSYIFTSRHLPGNESHPALTKSN